MALPSHEFVSDVLSGNDKSLRSRVTTLLRADGDRGACLCGGCHWTEFSILKGLAREPTVAGADGECWKYHHRRNG